VNRRRRLDQVRRNATPVETDLIDAFLRGQISRRDFLRRGAIVGVSSAVLGGIVSAVDPLPAAAAQGAPRDAQRLGGGELNIGVVFGEAFSGLDPVNMLDFGTYCSVSQCFEYLVGVGDDGFIGPTGLAESWSTNDDGTVWTFRLRPDVTWHEGTPFTSADVAATIDRLVESGAGLTGLVSEGAVDTPDDLTAVVNLDRANGNLPVFLSTFNPQSLITPVDYRNGTTLNERPTGTGPWLFDSHDPSSFTTTYVANDRYWGGRPRLDRITVIGFDDSASRVAALEAGEVDVIHDVSALEATGLNEQQERGDAIIQTPPSTNHRQIFFNTQLPEGGPFTDPRVRQALAHTLNRPNHIDFLFDGRGRVANDHPIHPDLPFFDPSAVPQRERNVELARQLLADAGFESVDGVVQVGDIAISVELGNILEVDGRDSGFNLTRDVINNADFYAQSWCPGAPWGDQPNSSGPTRPCGTSAPLGVVDWGHRPIPDVFLSRGLTTNADWNASNYASPEFDRLVADYESAVDVDGQTRALSAIQQQLHDDTPALIPFFFDFLAAHRSDVGGVRFTSLGHVDVSRAAKGPRFAAKRQR